MYRAGMTAGDSIKASLAPVKVSPGDSLEREIASGDSGLFDISAAPNQLLQLTIDKGDLALQLVLSNAAGERLFAQTSRGYETLKVSIPISAEGVYRLEVKSLEPEGTRRYHLSVGPLRAVTSQDQKAFIAQQSFAAASSVRADWSEKSFRQAVDDYDKAASEWLAAHDLRNAALASSGAGEVCFVLGEYREASKRYRSAAESARGSRSRVEEAKALSETGRLSSLLGNNDEALEFLNQALKILTESGGNQDAPGRQAHATILSNLGEVAYSRGNLIKARDNFSQALMLFKELGDRAGEARVHLFQAYISGGVGEPAKAAAEISQALSLYRSAANKSGEGLCLIALGLSHSLNRDEEQAIKLHREALAIFQTIGDRLSEAITLNALGQAYEFLRQYQVARENYVEALRLMQSKGAIDFATPTLYKIGGIYRQLGDFKQALTYFEKCLSLSRATKKRRTEANVLNQMALIYASQGKRAQAVDQYQKLLKFYSGISDLRGQANALNGLGDFLMRSGDKYQALDAYRRALPLSEQVGDKEVLTTTLYNIARAQRDLNDLNEAWSSIQRSISVVEDLRTNVQSPDFRSSYFSGARKHYDLCIDILMQLDREQPGKGFAAQALLASEKGRARTLLDLLTNSNADTIPGAPAELLDREKTLRSLIRSQAQYQMELTAGGVNAAESEEVGRQINQLRAQYEEVEGQLRERSPRFVNQVQSQVLNLERIQAELSGGDTILLEFALGEERSYLWAVTENSISSYQLPARAALESAAGEVYTLLTSRQVVGDQTSGSYQARIEESDRQYYAKTRQLSDLLLGPVAGQLGKKRLVIVAEGLLQYLPFSALPVPRAEPSNQVPQDSQLLIADHEIVCLPSLSALVAIRQEKHEALSSDKVVAILADPVFNGRDDRVLKNGTPATDNGASANQSQPNTAEQSTRGAGLLRLVHSSDEADAIVTTAPYGSTLVARGFDASRETATSAAVSKYQIIHFATHGFFNSEHPELSGIILSSVKQDGSKTDGFVSLQDVYRMNLPAQLVVVSACDTALGKDIRGEGLVGLTRGFMAAGSRSVVTSLWKVDDRATAELMKYFYSGMLQKGLTPAAALRSAKQKIQHEKGWEAPYFWAGFVLHGEYQERIQVANNSRFRAGLVTLLSLAVILVGAFIWHTRRRHFFST